MFRESDYCKEFKNGNINIRIPAGEIEDFKRDPVLFVDSALFWLDCYFIGETYCLSNFETGHTIYNSYSGFVYVFPWSYLQELEKGKTVKIHARVPDEWDRELINRDF